MTSLCEYMLSSARQKLKEGPQIRPPILRRQIAGNWNNPYDLDDVRNIDIKLYIDDFLSNYGTEPPNDQVESIAIFPTTENLLSVQLFLKNLNKEDMNLSKL